MNEIISPQITQIKQMTQIFADYYHNYIGVNQSYLRHLCAKKLTDGRI